MYLLHIVVSRYASLVGAALAFLWPHSPGSIQARWETLRVQQGSCLWWLVRDEETAPNAPNAQPLSNPSKKGRGRGAGFDVGGPWTHAPHYGFNNFF